MRSLRIFVSVALVTFAAGPIAGCKKDEPTAKPDTASSAGSANARDKNKMAIRNPLAPVAKIEPQVMKEYRMDVCYYGTLTLRQARDAYFASLGKDEPSEKKIPNFGKADTAAARPASSGAPAAGSAAARPPRPTSSAAASAGGRTPPGPMGDRDMRRPFDVAMRAPHERNARACTVAAGHKDPPMPDSDAAVAAFAPYAVELAKNIAAASTYYQREEYKKDSFAKGKELHKKLVDDFAKLDELSDKLGAAVEKWRKEHPVDVSKLDDGGKLAQTATEDARTVLTGMLAKKIDVAAHKAAVEKAEKSAAALKEFGTTNTADSWPKIMTPALEAFLKAAKEAGDKVTEKGLDSDAFLAVVNSFTSLIEAKQRALSRSLISKGQTADPAPARANPSGRPVPGSPPPAAPHE